ncbi:D-2-hydroxyacid dehydrogenase [Pedobacter polaris]|uniref:D-2-hydroxyacid dehydrogenase n=1 Tax=Pedobacter polaris TaxID=2571273 RepID=A0A4U1CMS7_9SPHI|nr:NAD(P)-dependent oxidoreductase [Pedobacter polaris]TKC06623.1 D-2-hydroxyacid dehydrogenase [Pedobacter polaris]
MKILVFTTLGKAERDQLKNGIKQNNEFFFKNDLTEDALIEILLEADVILGNLPIKHLSNPLPQLKFWQLDSAGFDQYQTIDLNIPVANMGTFYAQRCAETIVGGVIAFYRGIHTLIRLQVEKKWIGGKIRQEIQSISDKKIVILGAGAIALAAKEMLNGFGCTITLVARKNPNATIHSFNDLLKILPQTDAVINTLPGSAENYVNETFINAMKKGSIYANVGRGNTTDEGALISALTSGKIAGAILDVTEIEPLPSHSKLWDMDQVILTQHSGGGDENEVQGKVNHFIKNVNKFQSGQQPEDLIALKRGY